MNKGRTTWGEDATGTFLVVEDRVFLVTVDEVPDDISPTKSISGKCFRRKYYDIRTLKDLSSFTRFHRRVSNTLQPVNFMTIGEVVASDRTRVMQRDNRMMRQ